MRPKGVDLPRTGPAEADVLTPTTRTSFKSRLKGARVPPAFSLSSIPPEFSHQSRSAFQGQFALPAQLSYAVETPALRRVARPVLHPNHVAGELPDLEQQLGLDLVVGANHQRPPDEAGHLIPRHPGTLERLLNDVRVVAAVVGRTPATLALGPGRSRVNDVVPTVPT